MPEIRMLQCCGIKELTGIQMASNMRELIRASKTHAAAFIVFSTVSGSNGGTFTTYIRKHKLGTVTKMRANKNPNSQNMLSMWVWRVDRAKLLKHRA